MAKFRPNSTLFVARLTSYANGVVKDYENEQRAI
jgi:hypothetical protein